MDDQHAGMLHPIPQVGLVDSRLETLESHCLHGGISSSSQPPLTRPTAVIHLICYGYGHSMIQMVSYLSAVE